MARLCIMNELFALRRYVYTEINDNDDGDDD